MNDQETTKQKPFKAIEWGERKDEKEQSTAEMMSNREMGTWETLPNISLPPLDRPWSINQKSKNPKIPIPKISIAPRKPTKKNLNNFPFFLGYSCQSQTHHSNRIVPDPNQPNTIAEAHGQIAGEFAEAPL